MVDARKRKSSMYVPESKDKWAAVQPPEKAKPTPPPPPPPPSAPKPVVSPGDPPSRPTAPIQQSGIVAQLEAANKALREKLEGTSKQSQSVSAKNQELTMTNLQLGKRIEELTAQADALNARAVALAAVIAKGELGCKDTQAFAKSMLHLAKTFHDCDRVKVVKLLGEASPDLLEALIDAVSRIKT